MENPIEFNQVEFNQINSKFVEFLTQGRTHEDAYDLILLQGHNKSLVDLCVLEATVVSSDLFFQINCMAEQGLTPKQVVEFLQEKGYPDSVIKEHMEHFLEPEE